MIFEQESTRKFFLEITAKYFGSSNNPMLKLRDIPQWLGFLKSIGQPNSIFSEATVLLQHGSFYNFSNDYGLHQPDLFENYSAEYDAILMPCLRNVPSDFDVNKNIIFIPSYIESIFYKKNNWEEALKENISTKSIKNIRRIHKKVNKFFSMEWIKLSELTDSPSILAQFENIYFYNLQKYHAEKNYYDKNILLEIAYSALGEHFYMGLRYNAERELVQVCLVFLDPQHQSAYYLIQGIHHQLVSPEFNLYIASYCDIYNLMQLHDITTLYMGRGLEKQKQEIGANASRLLYNGFILLNANYEADLYMIADKARQYFSYRN